MLYGRLLDNNSHRGESLADLSYQVVLLQGGESRGDRFIESLRSDLCGVLNVPKILYRYCARSKNHVEKRSTFSFCSPTKGRKESEEANNPLVYRDLPVTVNFDTGSWCED